MRRLGTCTKLHRGSMPKATSKVSLQFALSSRMVTVRTVRCQVHQLQSGMFTRRGKSQRASSDCTDGCYRFGFFWLSITQAMSISFTSTREFAAEKASFIMFASQYGLPCFIQPVLYWSYHWCRYEES